MTLTTAQLARIVKRLPRSADGMPLVPGDKVWRIFRNGAWVVRIFEVTSIAKFGNRDFLGTWGNNNYQNEDFFSRKSAALAEAKRRNKAK